jgi:anti-anti-sigma factor
MTVTQDAVGRRIVLSPQEGLVAGGPAEEFEQRIQALLRDGYHDLLVDLRNVPRIDSRGVRALVRGHTTAQRLHASFRLVGPTAHIREVLAISRLDSIFTIYDTFEAARKREIPWDRWFIAVGGVALCAVLVFAGLNWPDGRALPDQGMSEIQSNQGQDLGLVSPFVALAKLFAAALIGMLVTAIHAPSAPDRPMGRSMRHAQILLCVSGAMMMIIIAGSLARAFGIAGAASIIRFRTPVEDPKDVTIIFLLMALGMACGLGAFGVAGLSTAFLCVFLLFLDRRAEHRARTLLIEIEAQGREFPTDHVQGVFARNRVVFEPREVSQAKETTIITYHSSVDPNLSLEDLSAQLMAGGNAGVKAVSWEVPKKGL